MAEMGGARAPRLDMTLSQRAQNRKIFDELSTPDRVRRLFNSIWLDALDEPDEHGTGRLVPASVRTQARALLLGQILGRPSAAGSAEETVGANPMLSAEHVRRAAEALGATGTDGKVIDFPPPGQ